MSITTPAADINKAASVENNKISLGKIREISAAARSRGSPSRCAPVGFGDRLAAARGMASKAAKEHYDAGDADNRLLVATPHVNSSSFLAEPVRCLLFDGNPSSAVPSGGRKHFGAVGQEPDLGALGDTRESRKLLTGPICLLRYACARPPQKPGSLKFLDSVCPVEDELAYEADVLVPTVIYTVIYMMTQRELTVYRQVVMGCPMAFEVHKMLAVGGAEFDRVNDRMGTFGLFVEGKELEEILQDDVMRHRLGVTWNLGESFFEPYREMV
jgi:hypothetical protein